jgi:RecG-like helicase
MLIAIDAGYQVANYGPTEILAEQHFLSFKKFLFEMLS